MTGRSWVAEPALRERRRRRYKPRRVAVLLVAESPPASGRSFYGADSGLYRAVCDVFTTEYPPTDGRSFLESFRDRGWYLVDLCRTPVNHLTPRERRQAHDEGVTGLARTIRRLRPGAVVLVVRMISPSVCRALQLAGWVGPYCELPYPGRWATAQHQFAKGFRVVLRTLPRREQPARIGQLGVANGFTCGPASLYRWVVSSSGVDNHPAGSRRRPLGACHRFEASRIRGLTRSIP